MEFGDKIKKLRKDKRLTQQQVAEELELSIKTYADYERGIRKPKKKSIYVNLANIFEVEVDKLLHYRDEFVLDAHEQYGSKGAMEATELIERIGGMYAGGELSIDDMDAVMKSMQELYWDAREDAKKKVAENNQNNGGF